MDCVFICLMVIKAMTAPAQKMQLETFYIFNSDF